MDVAATVHEKAACSIRRPYGAFSTQRTRLSTRRIETPVLQPATGSKLTCRIQPVAFPLRSVDVIRAARVRQGQNVQPSPCPAIV